MKEDISKFMECNTFTIKVFIIYRVCYPWVHLVDWFDLVLVDDDPLLVLLLLILAVLVELLLLRKTL